MYKEKEKDEQFDRKNAQGSVYDKMYFTDDQLKQGAEINKKAAAGEISWDSAHNWWEDARAGYGYTGGEDGHGFAKIGSKETAPTYTSNYQDAMNQAANALLNRKAFTYDPNTDPMYQQYADSYTRQGKQAMEDTLAQVSARTGGLASSYAGTAAQQTYDNYMSALADKVPELRHLAYQMYLGEEDSARNKFDVLSKLEDAEYGRYIDRWNQWDADRQHEYKKERDAVSDRQYKDEKAEKNQLLAAQMMAQAGDFSGYKNLLNLTDEQVSTLTGNYDSAKALTVAEMMAQTGDFSGYKSIFNLTDEQVGRLEKWYANQNAPKVTGGGGWPSMTLATAKAMAEQGQFTDDVLRALRDAGFNDEYLKRVYGYGGDVPEAEPEHNGRTYQLIYNRIKGGDFNVSTIAGLIERADLTDEQKDKLLTMIGY